MKHWVIRFLLPGVALLGTILGLIMIYLSLRLPPTPPIPFKPPVSPYAHYVAGSGLVEAGTENILIGVPFSEIVETVYAQVGDTVKKGDPLFKLNTDTLCAQLEEARAGYEVTVANYQKQLALPRPDDVPPLVAAVEQARAQYQDRIAQFDLYKNVSNPKAISIDDYNKRKYAEEAAKYALEEAQARLALVESGAWIRDLEIFRAQMKEAKKRAAVIETSIARSVIRAPYDGTVLRINIRSGELATATTGNTPLFIFGPLIPLLIRVDIDEADSWRVCEGAPGMAYVRGNSSLKVPLTFVVIEPYLLPKRSLTGETSETVDTRVLQVIYRFERGDLPIYPGQLMDVFLEARPNLGAT